MRKKQQQTLMLANKRKIFFGKLCNCGKFVPKAQRPS